MVSPFLQQFGVCNHTWRLCNGGAVPRLEIEGFGAEAWSGTMSLWVQLTLAILGGS
jgi:hypothetical protein